MVIVAQCLGLRAEELLAPHWSDIDFERLVIGISRAVVHGGLKQLKPNIRKMNCPLIRTSPPCCLPGGQRTPFAAGVPEPNNRASDHTSTIQQDYIRPAGEKLGLKESVAHLSVVAGRDRSATGCSGN